MTTLVAGATGATGRHLVQQLLDRDEQVKAIVRSPDALRNILPDKYSSHPNLTVIHASIADLTEAQLTDHVADCTAVASCLGHNLTFKGMFGQPRRLVTDATRNLCNALVATSVDRPAASHEATPDSKPVKFVLMNTTGNRNRDLNEPISFAQRCVVGLIRVLIPPHADNEQAADHLRTHVGQNHKTLQWAVVRPDSLIDEDEVTPYDLHPSPTRSAIFNAGKTSRINVAAFMAELITNDELWTTWQGQMPVIYNTAYQANGARTT